jgi:hypothetical protein
VQKEVVALVPGEPGFRQLLRKPALYLAFLNRAWRRPRLAMHRINVNALELFAAPFKVRQLILGPSHRESHAVALTISCVRSSSDSSVP